MSLHFPFKKTLIDSKSLKEEANNDYKFHEAIYLFTSQKERLGISLEELSNKTKISRNVLIAIENGWEKYLPEKTYLVSMIKILETELSLEKGSLNGILAKKIVNKTLSKLKFNFINIDILSSWAGSLLYFIFMLLSIFALNFQQKYLLKIHSLSTEPVIINKNNIEDKNIINSKD